MAPSTVASATEASRKRTLSTLGREGDSDPSFPSSVTPESLSSATTQPSSQLLLRDALIRLNNIAVEILYRYEKCRPSIDTYKDALLLMKQQHPQSHNNSAFDRAIYEATTRTDLRYEQIMEEAQQSESSTSSTSSSSATPPSVESDVVSSLPKANGLGMVVLPSSYDAEQAYHLLATIRTSKVCLTLDPTDNTIDLAFVRSIFVYNYGIAHRCCSVAPAPSTAVSTTPPAIQNNTAATTEAVATSESRSNSDSTNNSDASNQLHSNKKNLMESFCLQIFQYAETLLPPEDHNARSDVLSNGNDDKASTSSSNNHMLLFRLVLTRYLMMLSCRLGLSLCEHYKETLDPIVSDILGPLGGGGGGHSNDSHNNSQPPPGASAA